MKIIIGFVSLFFLSIIQANAQTKVVVSPKNSYVRENLDLDAVSNIYEESSNLQDFENRLNNPGYRISNLDLNNDEKVDYLRVSQKMEGNMIKVIIQSEIEPNTYEDVASMNLLIQPKKKRSNPVAVIPVLSSILDIIYKIVIIKNELQPLYH
ncbi:hypothetical protein IR010_12330 [Flavobacterium sp. MR2016-29]|uniref:hypothetical protein n=1 Tax=Flavobacterium sp. MR2016-29 TaxID=2783795 RepID=UPI00188D19FC|nr:hypothetical protein [Flavobacterium sp. MR2016-29]MBF4493328.1 hypothetical protein [Flavobacterium sp. MR2016-29]